MAVPESRGRQSADGRRALALLLAACSFGKDPGPDPTGTAGLAGRVSSVLQNDGWTLGQVGNWAGAPQQTSRIFYAGEAQRANAEALGTLLGIPAVVNSQEFQVPLVVVLGPDYR